MRRSALHLGIPLVCALLGVVLVAASGKADDTETLPDLAMAVAPAPAPAVAAPPAPAAAVAAMPLTTRALPSAPTPRPAEPAAEMLITSAPIQVEKPVTMMIAPARPRVMMMEVTAYCACKKCCGPKAQGITASGKRVNFNGGLFVAADKKVFNFYTKLKIPGYANGRAVPVLDRGGAIKGNKLDVYFASHQRALKWGRQRLEVTVVE